jgi:acetyl-CoA acetyltransferase
MSAAWLDRRDEHRSRPLQTTEHVVEGARHLRGRYAIVGVGETTYTRGAGMTTRALACWAIRSAIQDAGLTPRDVDGMLAYQLGDSISSTFVAGDLSIRPSFFMDVYGGGSSTEALVGLAMGAIEGGMCSTVVIYRAMNGYSQSRVGGTGRAETAIVGEQLHERPYGWGTPGQLFAPSFMRHMYEYGTRPEQVAMVRVAHSGHASNNPKALHRKRVTVEDVLASRIICTPLHLLDCCVETDNATAIVVTSIERARDLRHPPAVILGVVGRTCKPRPDMHYQHGPITTVAAKWAAPRLWSGAGLGPEDVDVTGSYDAFTFTTMLQLEDYGFCTKGEGGAYVSSGTIELGGRRPNNTSGGHLCEGYTHGVSMVVENVRQLRHDADDSCPTGADGRRAHTYDYREGGCRQVRTVNVTANLGWGTPAYGSALVMARTG